VLTRLAQVAGWGQKWSLELPANASSIFYLEGIQCPIHDSLSSLGQKLCRHIGNDGGVGKRDLAVPSVGGSSPLASVCLDLAFVAFLILILRWLELTRS
jgi:hypothetical protein